MGVENFTTTPVSGTRRAKRARVLLAAKLQTPFGEIEARLRDLSQKGALVECSPTPPQGSEVVFSRGPISVPARVAWAGSGRVGLEFHHQIDENEMLVQLKRVTNLQARERFRRPGIKENASEKERALAAAWGVQVGITLPDGDY